MMRKIIAFVCFAIFLFSRAQALSWHAVNVDYTTAAAMSAAYATEALEESNTATHISKILEHYKTAGIASAGIFLSKKKEREARRNPGLFATEENYYYHRIFRLVKDGIMPKFITVAGKMIKQPENALYWGPYLYKTTHNVENLCKQFECVVTNGKFSFKDIQFLLINEKLQKLFDLAQLADVDWKSLFSKLGEFGKGISQDDIADDFKHLGSVIAQAGKVAFDHNLEDVTKIGGIFKAKPREIARLYESFRDKYKSFKNATNVKEILYTVIGEGDEATVDKLFQISDYNISGYISSYIKEMQGQYYTQRWYIYQQDAGSRVLCDYNPAGYNNWGDAGWNLDWFVHSSGKKRQNYSVIPCYKYLTEAEDTELKDKLFQRCEWNEAKCNEYNIQNPGHDCTITYVKRHEDRNRHYGGGLFSHSYDERYCFHSYRVKVRDQWDIREDVYEEIFDSQTMDKTTFMKRMQARLQGVIDEHEKFLGEHPTISFKLGSDNPRYYTMADERKMQGCSSVSFLAACEDGASLGEGSFNWKENGNQGGSLEWPKSKDFAMEATPNLADDSSKALIEKQNKLNQQIANLKAEIKENDTKQKNLLSRIQQAKFSKNYPLVNKLDDEYNALSNENALLKQDLRQKERMLSELNQALDDYYKDLGDNLSGSYRIPSNMASLASMYHLQWADEGEWIQGSDEYVFVRHAYCPDAKSQVTYTATLKLSRKPRYALGIRIHRAILSVDFKLTSSSSSENVLEVMQLDMNKSEKELTDEVNERMRKWMDDMPNCSISLRYNYQSQTKDDEDDEDGIHLLLASDRLQVARYVEQELTRIYAQLVLIEKVMTQRECVLDFLKRQIFDVVSRRLRNTIASYALQRWEEASLRAMKKCSPLETEQKPTSQKQSKQ